MSAFFRILRSRWVITFVAVLLLAFFVWFFGPLLGIGAAHPLDSEVARIIVIVAIVALWLVENLIHMLRAQQRDKALVEGAAQPVADAADATASAEELALLSERLKEAMAALKKAKIGGSRRYLYQLPWYMFIGPPGAGKTTALLNCGLKFPLAETGGARAVAGVGGTRNCDWWFTDQAVLIDTAGRYTTQDSNSGVDSRAWLGFLGLLKKNRPRQPLNGVLVAVSLSDLASLGEAERAAHARAIRTRIRELADQLGVRVPVYVLFTKADLIAGFVEFFDNMGREERDQVWGMTLPLDNGRDEAGAVGGFAAGFDALMARLNDRMLDRVQQETDLQRRRSIWAFPQQLASLRDVASDFLTEIFRPSRLEARPLLRGIYFTSGTQDGTPIDRLLGAMAAQFSLPRQAVSAFSGAGRSYFLGRLIRDVVFGEAGLVSRDPKVERRRKLVHIGAYAVAAVVLLVLIGFWTVSYFGNRAIIAEAHAAAAHYEQQYAELQRRGPNDADIPAVLPALATLRAMPGGYDRREEDIPLAVTFGLYQGHKISAVAVDAYVRALDALLLPRLLARLEGQMRAHMDKPDFLYEALKVYLILGRQGPLDRDLVTQWMAADAQGMVQSDDNVAAFAGHLQALLEYPLAAVPLDGPLVAQVRGILTRQPLAEYVYNRMLRSAVVQSLPEWTIADNAGPAGGRVFELRDQKALNSGLPGIFTWNGYHTVLLPLLPQVTKDASEDAWVLGRQDKGNSVVGSVAQMNQLRRDVLALYLDDYTRRWDELLADVALKPFGNLTQGLDELFVLSAPDSPLRDLLTAIDAQTQLSRPAALETAAGQAEAKASKVGKKLGGFAAYLAHSGMSVEQTEITNVLGEAFGSDPAGKPIDPATRVDEHFRALHLFVAGDKEHPAQLDTVIGKIQQIYQGMNQAANAPNQGQALLNMVAGGGAGGAGGGDAAQQLQQIAQSVPKPVAAMLQTVSSSSSAVTANGAGEQLVDAWKSKVLPLCQAAFNRYPFIATSSQDVPIDDFTRLLGPNGLMDQFFDQYLKPVVDTTTLPWHWQAGGDAKLGLSAESLAEFQRAAEIRDALFAAGGAQMSVKFQLIPTQLDPGLAQVSLEVAGQRLSYAHGPTEPTALQWPAANGTTQVRLTMTPTSGGAATVISNSGPWALLRLLDAAHVASSGQPDKFVVTFTSPAGAAGFELDANSVRNPFTMTALRNFRCPAKL